ncbi:MAG TPA: hypothetical protein VFW87_18945 [Pirellulales bacterium]|nr:hypothetical protein [Pirellulales bacterium]
MDAILPSPTAEARAALAEADVIIGIDQSSQRQFTVYGTPPLESTMSLKQLSAMKVVRVLLDCDKQELDALMAVVRRVKGPERYEGTDE